jgi:hypothetical protein
MLFPHLIFYSFNKVFSLSTGPSEIFASEDTEIPSQNAAISFVAKVIGTNPADGCRFFTGAQNAGSTWPGPSLLFW